MGLNCYFCIALSSRHDCAFNPIVSVEQQLIEIYPPVNAFSNIEGKKAQVH